ncbi:MAG TPA: molybdate ABC transporter permease subunit [Bacillota bacterium]|nr:molybdate ABC transporter permease subunit [Bacillota bacterium]
MGLTTKFLIPALLTIKIASAATLLSFLFGGLMAWLLQSRKGSFIMIIECFIALPLVLPPTILGYYLLLLLARSGPVGTVLPIDIIFTPWAAIIAATAASTPIMFKTVKSFFETTEPEIIGAARLDGASEWKLLLLIRIPLTWKGILTGIILAFLRSIGEFGATMMIAGNIPGKTQTMALAIWDYVMSGDLSSANQLALIVAVTCLVTLTLLRFLDNKLDYR